jgi:thymidylate kinase
MLVAVEGLDGSGKSTTTQALAKILNAVLVTNPPESFRAERAAADRRTEAERRAWYRAGNLAAQREADAQRARGRSVVFDRSFASTAAFGCATTDEVASADDWPASLERPDLIVLLDVDEGIRCARLDARGGVGTPEEQWLRDDEAFRTRVLQGLKALGAVPVDASRPVEEVVAQILSLIPR